MTRSWVLTYNARPWTTNTDRNMHHHQRAKHIKEWRSAFALLAREQRIPPLDQIEVRAIPILRDRRRQDVAACQPAVKAAIDGLVDAGVIPDDTADHLLAVSFRPPLLEAGQDALDLIVTEITDAP